MKSMKYTWVLHLRAIWFLRGRKLVLAISLASKYTLFITKFIGIFKPCPDLIDEKCLFCIVSSRLRSRLCLRYWLNDSLEPDSNVRKK